MSGVASENLKDVITKTPLTFCRDADTAMLNTRLDYSPVCVKPQKYQFAVCPAPVADIMLHRGCA
ncbi:hypothetical protein JS562_41120, partial [Agrobacterium sp. S2]|nr:hypothetical protein [Agrobacterium sp. S2]